MFMEIVMGRSDEFRKAVGYLAKAAVSAKGPGFTGQIVVRLHVHKGTVGKVTAQSEEVIDQD